MLTNLRETLWKRLGAIGSRLTVETSPALRPRRSQRRKPSADRRQTDKQTNRQTVRETDRQQTSDNSTKSTLISYLNIVEAAQREMQQEEEEEEDWGQEEEEARIRQTDRGNPMPASIGYGTSHRPHRWTAAGSWYEAAAQRRCMPSAWANTNRTSCPRDIRP